MLRLAKKIKSMTGKKFRLGPNIAAKKNERDGSSRISTLTIKELLSLIHIQKPRSYIIRRPKSRSS